MFCVSLLAVCFAFILIQTLHVPAKFLSDPQQKYEAVYSVKSFDKIKAICIKKEQINYIQGMNKEYIKHFLFELWAL